MITIRDLDFQYLRGGFRLRVPDLAVADGQRVAVLGASGSGKTTLLDLVAGILAPASGAVTVAGQDLSRPPDGARRHFRITRIGLIFQAFELLEYLTVRDNILLPYGISSTHRRDADTETRLVLLERSSELLRARAAATPLLLGAPGSPLELALNSLYFNGDPPAPLKYAAVGELTDSGLATAITGEAVLGASAARALGASPGDGVVTAPETVFDLTGTYPIRLKVVGVLAPTGTPDHQAVFVDVRMAWIVGGIGHGHEDLQAPEASVAVLQREGATVVANAAMVQYREITPENLADFHFHGPVGEFPLSAIIAVPADKKSGVLLEGRYQNPDSPVSMVRPSTVMDELLATVFTVRQYILAAVALVGVATLATIALVFLLSIRLRRAEISTMTRVGAAPGRVAAILGAEIVLVLTASLVLAGLLTALATALGEELFQWVLLAGFP